MTSRTNRMGWLLAALAAGLPALAPASAQAAKVEALSNLVFTAASGESNNLTISSQDGLTFTVQDTGAPLTSGSGCAPAGDHGAVCSFALGAQPTLQVDLGDGRDTVDLAAVHGSAPCTVDAGAGDDVLTGSPGADVLGGGTGDDLIDGRDGADQVDGGVGSDTIDYSRRTAPVAVDLASTQPVNGEAGEGDVLSSIENANGGDGADTLVGSSSRNVLDGGPGDDRLDGRAGGDRLVGGDGWDTADYSRRTEDLTLAINDLPVSGGQTDGPAGARDRIDATVEQLVAGSGNDVLTGDAGNNVLDGGRGADVLNGGAGEDAADYSHRSDALRLADDGRPLSGGLLDGPHGARDTIGADVEDLWGGSGADTLTGNSGDNLLDGGPGPDVLAGGGGEDAADYSERSTPVTAALDGTPNSGNDEDGPPGQRDTLSTDIEDLFGGAGNDQLAGNDARNYLGGMGGDDLMDARSPGADYADCGDGNDLAWVTPADIAASDCERIGAGPDTTGPATEGDRVPPQVRVSLLRGQSLATVLASGLGVHFTCSETCALDARLLLARSGARRLGIKLGPSKLLVARTPARRDGPGQGSLTLVPQPRITGLLRHAASAGFKLVVTGRDAAGNVRRVRRDLQLLPGRARLRRAAGSGRAPFRLARGLVSARAPRT